MSHQLALTVLPVQIVSPKLRDEVFGNQDLRIHILGFLVPQGLELEQLHERVEAAKIRPKDTTDHLGATLRDAHFVRIHSQEAWNCISVSHDFNATFLRLLNRQINQQSNRDEAPRTLRHIKHTVDYGVLPFFKGKEQSAKRWKKNTIIVCSVFSLLSLLLLIGAIFIPKEGKVFGWSCVFSFGITLSACALYIGRHAHKKWDAKVAVNFMKKLSKPLLTADDQGYWGVAANRPPKPVGHPNDYFF